MIGILNIKISYEMYSIFFSVLLKILFFQGALMKLSRLSLCAKITLLSFIFFSFLTLIFMCICIQRNQADFKHSQIACLHFSVYCSETEMNRRQKSLVCMNAHHFSGQKKLFFLLGLEVKWKWLLAVREREHKYRSSACDTGWGRTRSSCSQWVLWSFAFAVVIKLLAWNFRCN